MAWSAWLSRWKPLPTRRSPDASHSIHPTAYIVSTAAVMVPTESACPRAYAPSICLAHVGRPRCSPMAMLPQLDHRDIPAIHGPSAGPELRHRNCTETRQTSEHDVPNTPALSVRCTLDAVDAPCHDDRRSQRPKRGYRLLALFSTSHPSPRRSRHSSTLLLVLIAVCCSSSSRLPVLSAHRGMAFWQPHLPYRTLPSPAHDRHSPSHTAAPRYTITYYKPWFPDPADRTVGHS
jgi:hypothetical protein